MMLRYPRLWLVLVSVLVASVFLETPVAADRSRSLRTFRCQDGTKHVNTAQLCDGILDCNDGSDENNFTLCTTRPRACTREEFTCANRKCVPLARQCNREDDCQDYSDEMGCNPSGSCSDNTCTHGCTPGFLPGAAYLCHCAQGFTIGDDHRSCVDIDECSASDVHHCPQLCENTIGSFSCRCHPGFLWSQYRCLATGSPTVLVYALGSRLLELVKDKFHYFIHSETTIRALDIDPVEKTVYWVDSDNVLKRSLVPHISENAPTSGKEQVLMETMRVNSIAIDWIARNLYYAQVSPDVEKGLLAVSTVDGRYWRRLIDDNIQHPHAIAVAPEVGQLVWTDIGCSPRIESAWMDGSHRRVLVHTDVRAPTGLTIDYRMRQRVFWCDKELNRIESINLDGSDRLVIVSGKHLEHPVRLDVFGLTLYWSTSDSNKVRRLDKFGRGTHVTVTSHATYVKDFRVYQSMKHVSVVNPCLSLSCSHLCLLTPSSAVCACPEGTAFQRFTRKVCDAVTERKAGNLQRCSCKTGQVCKVDAITLKLYCI